MKVVKKLRRNYHHNGDHGKPVKKKYNYILTYVHKKIRENATRAKCVIITHLMHIYIAI